MQNWGLVSQVSPSLEVRFSGEDGDVPVNQIDGLTLTTGDKVALHRYGTQWYVTAVLVAA